MRRWVPVALTILALGLLGCDDDEGPTQPSGDDVEGRVLDRGGQPVSGIAVVVSGKPAVTTASDGSFTVADVGPTYDATLIFSTEKTAIVYKGLSRRDPTLSHIDVLAAQKSASISGTVPASPTKQTRVFFVSGDVNVATFASQITGDYNLTPRWYGPATALVGKLYVLRWSEGVDGLPEDFDGYAVRDQTVSETGTFVVDFGAGDLTDTAEATISGSVVAPAGYDLQTKEYGFALGASGVSIDSQGTPSPDFAFTVPDVPGLTFYAVAAGTQPTPTNSRATVSIRWGITAGATGISIVLESAPQLSLPVHQATGVTTETPFVWSPGGGVGVSLFVASANVPTDPSIGVVLTGTTTQLPDLSAQGLGLPAGAQYDWRLRRYMLIASVDEVASESFSLLLGVTGGDAGTQLSESFEFTTEP
jgi:hypothetical protein